MIGNFNSKPLNTLI